MRTMNVLQIHHPKNSNLLGFLLLKLSNFAFTLRNMLLHRA